MIAPAIVAAAIPAPILAICKPGIDVTVAALSAYRGHALAEGGERAVAVGTASPGACAPRIVLGHGRGGACNHQQRGKCEQITHVDLHRKVPLYTMLFLTVRSFQRPPKSCMPSP